MTDVDPLKADCSACFALCCIALRFDRQDGFGHDKPQGQPCHFLQQNYACKIHPKRETLGYDGCIDFDCFGAGQIASAQFAHQNWQGDPAIARKLFARFAQLLQVQELRAAISEASADMLSEMQSHERETILRALEMAAAPSDEYRECDHAIQQAKNFVQRLASEDTI